MRLHQPTAQPLPEQGLAAGVPGALGRKGGGHLLPDAARRYRHRQRRQQHLPGHRAAEHVPQGPARRWGPPGQHLCQRGGKCRRQTVLHRRVMHQQDVPPGQGIHRREPGVTVAGQLHRPAAALYRQRHKGFQPAEARPHTGEQQIDPQRAARQHPRRNLEVAGQVVGFHPLTAPDAPSGHHPGQHQIHQHIPALLPQKDPYPPPGKGRPHNGRRPRRLTGQLHRKGQPGQQNQQAAPGRHTPRQTQPQPVQWMPAQHGAARQQQHGNPAIGEQQHIQIYDGSHMFTPCSIVPAPLREKGQKKAPGCLFTTRSLVRIPFT